MDSHFFISYDQYITLVCKSKAAYLLRILPSHLSLNIPNSIKLLESQKYFEFKIDCQLIEYVSSRDSSEPLGCSLPALSTDLPWQSSDFFDVGIKKSLILRLEPVHCLWPLTTTQTAPNDIHIQCRIKLLMEKYKIYVNFLWDCYRIGSYF